MHGNGGDDIALLLDEAAYALPFIADDQSDGAGQVLAVHHVIPHIGAGKPEAFFLQILDGLTQVCDLRHRRVVQRSRGSLRHHGGQAHCPVLRDDDAVGAGQVGGSYDRPQIVGIFNAVQKDQEGILPLLSGLLQHIRNLCIGKCRRIGDDALMLSGLGHLVQTLAA